MIDRQAIAEARRVLGCQLAELRKAAGYSQHRFAPLTMYARGTLANVEIGRQHVARSFWQRCDEELGTDGALTRSFDDLDALSRRRHEQTAQQAADEVAEPTGPDSPQQQANHGEWAVTWDPMRWRTLFAWGLTTTAATGLGAGSADVARRMSLGCNAPRPAFIVSLPSMAGRCCGRRQRIRPARVTPCWNGAATAGRPAGNCSR